MKKFDYSLLEYNKYDMETVQLISHIYMYKDKQYDKKGLNVLTSIANIQTVYASNAIEDVYTSNARLRKICTQKEIHLKNDSEKVIKGYYDVLQIIYTSFEHIPLQSHFILQMHKDLYKYTSQKAGAFKNIQNYINAKDENGNSHTLFTPLTPYETLEAIDSICTSYNECIQTNKVEPLILIPTFIHDFLCVHPFLHGSGKMSRLLMDLLLMRSGYHIGQYISLEQKILEQKKEYYQALMKCHDHWTKNEEDDTEFIKFMLRIILSSYEELDCKMKTSNFKKSAYEQVLNCISNYDVFKKSDIMEYCPMVSQKSIEACLKKLQEENKISKHATGRASFYKKLDLKPAKE